MPKLPQISGRELVKAFIREGWYEVHTRGSHTKMRKDLVPLGRKTVIIPQHKTLKKGTLTGILKDAGVTVERLSELL